MMEESHMSYDALDTTPQLSSSLPANVEVVLYL